jgi:alpha-L-fucosidase
MMQQWFPDAKLGIFIHYGIYAVKGIDESWSFFNGKVTYDEYMEQLSEFTASNYDPEAWAELFERVGAKYAVLTTKHHDGVALWDTKANDFSVVHQTPAGRDLITPYVEALRRHNLKVGFYFSHLDWSHPDYATILPRSMTLRNTAPNGLPTDLRTARRTSRIQSAGRISSAFTGSNLKNCPLNLESWTSIGLTASGNGTRTNST